MKKKMFFIAGLAVSAIAASCFIPLADGNYWWSAWNEPHVTVVEFPGRFPAGTNPGTPIDPNGEDPTLPQDAPVEEPPPDYTGGSDKNPTQPTYPTPEPAPQPQAQNCLEKAFSADCNPNRWPGCIKGVSFSSAYINSYLRAAISAPYNLGSGSGGRTCGTNCKRLALLGVVTAGYCNPTSKYQSGYQSSTVLPRLVGPWSDHDLRDRKSNWLRNQQGNPLYCQHDSFDANRTRICEIAYKHCNLQAYVDRDCRGVVPDHDNDDNDHGGGSTTGSTSGGTTGEREVGEGTNQGAGHGADQGGGHGEGPSGVSQ